MTADVMGPNPRRYIVTPDRAVLFLLAVECLLLLCEQLHVFTKGYAIVFALATSVVAMLLLPVWSALALIAGFRFQFKLRSLFVLVVITALPLSWAAMAMRQAPAVQAIEAAHGWVEYDWQFEVDGKMALFNPVPRGPRWLRDLGLRCLFESVVVVHLEGENEIDGALAYFDRLNTVTMLYLGPTVTDVGLEHLKGLSKVDFLQLPSAKVTDAGLRNIAGMRQLEYVYLISPQITDAGLQYLEGMKNLQELVLAGTGITDAGLARLGGLRALNCLGLADTGITGTELNRLELLAKLRILDLGRTQVRDAGLEKIEGLTQLESLYLDDTQVTDKGLKHVARLTRLTELNLAGTRITDSGLQLLGGLSRLTRLDLGGTRITDAGLQCLARMPQLNVLTLDGTTVTDTAEKRLGQTLPGCMTSHRTKYRPHRG
jgi:hypothetical protein